MTEKLSRDEEMTKHFVEIIKRMSDEEDKIGMETERKEYNSITRHVKEMQLEYENVHCLLAKGVEID